MSKECEDCGDKTERRTRCKRCGLLVCRWCYHHIHSPSFQRMIANSNEWNKQHELCKEDVW